MPNRSACLSTKRRQDGKTAIESQAGGLLVGMPKHGQEAFELSPKMVIGDFGRGPFQLIGSPKFHSIGSYCYGINSS